MFNINEYLTAKGDLCVKGRLKTWGVPNINNLTFLEGCYSMFIRDYYKKHSLTIPLCLNHDENDVIGTVDDIVSDDVGLNVFATIFKQSLTPRLRRLLSEGVLQGFSDTARVHVDDGGLVDYAELLEVSLVYTPADPAATLSIVKPFKIDFINEQD